MQSPGHLRVTSRACQSCAQSKSKCVPATDLTEGKCLRCFKSKRECLFPDKTVKKRKAPTSSTAELEERIQNLSSLLVKQQQTTFKSVPSTPEGQAHAGSSHSLQTSNPPRSLLPSSQDPWLERVPHRSNVEANTLHQSRLDNNPGESNFASRTSPIIGSILHAKDGEYFLKIYRDHFSRRFPFIVISPTSSAKELRIQRPWLFKAVTLAASQDNRAQQLILGQELITDLALAMVVKAERSLDMLQGLVIYGAWAYSIANCAPQISSTGHSLLAISMVFDLGLNRTVGESELPEMLSDTTKSFGTEHHRASANRTMEERRTVLSVYFLTSMLSWCMKRMEGLQYSPYLEYCRRSLLEHAEHESDIILAALVKIQSIIEKTNRLILDKDYPGGEKVPVWMHSKVGVLELHAYWESLSLGVRQNEMLALNYLSAEIALYEPCVQKLHFPRDLANGNMQRLHMLQACLDTTRKLMERCLARPISEYFTFCIVDVAIMGLSCSSLLKLSLVDEVGWDLANVRRIASFKDYFERYRSNIEQVGLAIDKNQREPCKPSFFTSGNAKMRMIQTWFEGKSAGESQAVGFPSDMTELLNVNDLGTLSDGFWEDFMAEGGGFV